VSDLYFAAAFLPDTPSRTTLVTLHNTIDLPRDLSDPNSQKTPADVIGLAVGDQDGYTRLRVFAGPKQLDVLKNIHATGASGKADGPSLEPLIQFGWLTIIAKPLYLALRFLRGLLGPGAYNWGWAIIIVTVIFNLVLLPTRFMMMKSSLKMMRIQPKVEAIKKRYSHLKMNDPKRTEMNTEMMELYKTEGVNMYGGCLPLLLQMPLFFAYYRVLLNAVELRQAHWFWLTDLSSPDPLHILPIFIIVSMFLVQYLTPSPGMDPAQRRMMAFMMPVIMGFTLWHFASGLALYWITGNIINLAIQIGINQSSMGKEMHAIAARRALKKTSGDRTVFSAPGLVFCHPCDEEQEHCKDEAPTWVKRGAVWGFVRFSRARQPGLLSRWDARSGSQPPAAAQERRERWPAAFHQPSDPVPIAGQRPGRAERPGVATAQPAPG
jgi:YidC/Oxa1 family membrane protein insertase